MYSTDHHLAAIARRHDGNVPRAAARAVGITDGQLRARVRTGTLLQVGPHTFRPYGAPDTIIGRLRSLLVDLGPDAVASGPTAAALHGFDGWSLRAPFDVTVGRGRNLTRVGHRIHTTTTLAPIDRSTAQGCALMSAARTLIDLSRTAQPEQLRVALDSAVRDRLVTERTLHRRITALRSSGRYGIPQLLQVLEAHETVSGAHSWLEREYLRLLTAAGAPRPVPQQVLSRAGDRLVRVDFRFPGTAIVVEVMGYRYHRTATQMARDAERTNALLADGFLPYQFTYDDVVNQPDRVVAVTLQALSHDRAA